MKLKTINELPRCKQTGYHRGISSSIRCKQRGTNPKVIRSLFNSRLNSSIIIISLAIAFIVTCPIACLAMNKWLEKFAYKTTLSWWIFVLAGMLALGIVLLTVSFQSWRAATRNPVEALRYE
ncbi:MAG TPA: hypothetical protein VLA03_09825 [Draconibacterium sp.]|nr:hypothetical protein [Draconibacterium sp.]